MKSLAAMFLLLAFFAQPSLAQHPQDTYSPYQGRFSPEDQKRFDNYYQRWQDYRRENNSEQIISMEKRMQDVMEHYQIPLSVPYDALASSGRQAGYNPYHGRIAAEDQKRFDNYYSRWLDYKRTNNREQALSMDKRMQDVMQHNNIPATVPFGALASNGTTAYWASPWRDRLTDEDQKRFDSYFTRWQGYRRENNREQITSMEKRMLDVMAHYNIPETVAYDQVASASLVEQKY